MIKNSEPRVVIIDGFPDFTISENREVRSIKTNKVRKPYVDRSGYIRVTIKNSEGKSSTQGVHRLLMIAFVPNPENKPQVNHIDGDKSNNSLENLEWCTSGDNIRHAYRTGLRSTTDTQREVARQKGLKRRGIGKIIVNMETGVFYENTKEATLSLGKGYSYKYIRNILCGYKKNYTSLRYA